jgi:hypothetical protein
MGLSLILLGIAALGVWVCWAATRIWMPLNEPISLSPGHIRTPEFKINVESAYQIEVEVNRGFDFWGVPCLIGGDQCHGDSGVLAVSWSLSSGGRSVANGASENGDRNIQWKATMGRVVGGFNAEKGSHVLDVDVLQDGSRLNAGAPRLVVSEAGVARWTSNDIRSAIFLLFLILTGSGTYLIIRPILARRRETLAELARNCSLTLPGPQSRNLRTDRAAPTAPILQSDSGPRLTALVGALQHDAFRCLVDSHALETVL